LLSQERAQVVGQPVQEQFVKVEVLRVVLLEQADLPASWELRVMVSQAVGFAQLARDSDALATRVQKK
jgi:hypothetical protein